MIKAKFIKAEPTKDGITIILKAEKNKANLRLAVDLMDEECMINMDTAIPDSESEFTDITVKQSVAEVMHRIHEAVDDFYTQLSIPKQEEQPCLPPHS